MTIPKTGAHFVMTIGADNANFLVLFLLKNISSSTIRKKAWGTLTRASEHCYTMKINQEMDESF